MGKWKGIFIGQWFEANESLSSKINDPTTLVRARDQKPNRPTSELKATMCQPEMQWYTDPISGNLTELSLVVNSCSLLQMIRWIS